jgi:alkylated DNA nucleotide flippase Atl1
MAKTKSWVEKLHQNKGLPKVEKITPKMSQRWRKVGETFAIPRPLDVDEIIKKVPKGKLITVAEIRQKVAEKYKATIGCPLTCGIFAWIAAWAVEEEKTQGKKNTTPWWRTLKSGGILNEKFPGEISQQKALLQAEGHKVVKKGKKYVVLDYEKSLVKI